MNVVRTMLRGLRLGFTLLLILYWVGFVGYTIGNLATGGPSGVIAWYIHISTPPFRAIWNWRSFLAGQAINPVNHDCTVLVGVAG